MSWDNHEGIRLKCPSCGATYLYSHDRFDEQGVVQCQNCMQRFYSDSLSGERPTIAVDYPDDIVPSRKPFLTITTSEGVRVKCPHCGAEYIYKEHQKLEDGRVNCQNCGTSIDASGEEVLVYDTPTESDQRENTALICILVLIILFVPLIFAIPLLICIVAFKTCGVFKEQSQETKIYRHESQGPDVR